MPRSILSFGGPDLLSQYIDILRTRYPKELLLIQSGGVIKKGNSRKQQKDVLKFLEDKKFDSILFTTNEFINFDKELHKKQKTLFLNSNIFDLTNDRAIHSKMINSFMLQKINGIDVGLIGISPYRKDMPGIYFQDEILTVLKKKKILIKKGAKIIVLIIDHAKKEDLIKIIKRLPPASVQLIITSDIELETSIIHGFPVVSSAKNGEYINRVSLVYNTKLKRIEKERTIFHPKVKTCRHFYVATDDCHIEEGLFFEKKKEDIIKGQYKMIPAKFLGTEIY